MSAGLLIALAYSGSEAPGSQNIVHHISKRETLDHPPRGGKVWYRFSAFWLDHKADGFVIIYLLGQVLSTHWGECQGPPSPSLSGAFFYVPVVMSLRRSTFIR